jgi:hypothetical protein
VLFIII